LLPKKSKDLIPLVAKELNLSEDEIGEIVDIYWKEIRKALTETKSPRVMVNFFGTFRVKENTLQKLKETHEAFLKKQDPETMTFHKHHWRVEIEKRLENLEKLIAIVESDKIRKRETKQKVKENGITKNMEK
jgi:nucleoid DNA-binding protein